MKAFNLLTSILMGLHEHSMMYLTVLDADQFDKKTIDTDNIFIGGDLCDVTFTPIDGGNRIQVEATNLVDSTIIFADAFAALNFGLYRLGVRLNVEDEDIITILPTGYPVLPEPKCTFADHSVKAFTEEQMLEYATASVALFTGMKPYEIDAHPWPADQMYEERGVEFCEECGGQIGDDCDCNNEGEEEDDEEGDWTYEDCPHCGCSHRSGEPKCDCEGEE